MNLIIIGSIAMLIAVALFYQFTSYGIKDPSHSPPREISIKLGQTVRDFMQVNSLMAERLRTDPVDTNNYDLALDSIADTGPIIFSDHWIRLKFKIGMDVVDLGSGRILFINQVAGRIVSFVFTPNAQLQPLEQTIHLVKQLLETFLAKGWKSNHGTGLNTTLLDRDFLQDEDKIYAQLVDNDNNLLSLTVMASHRAEDAGKVPANYAFRVGLYWAERNRLSYGDLIYPRRLYVNGRSDQILRLRAWFEDPDWMPEKHGMKDLGGEGEQKKWSLPQK